MADFAPILKQTFNFEGGYDARANDSGNYNSKGQLVGTNYGISAPLYEEILKRPPSAADMKALTKEKAAEIYKKKFWDKLPGDPIKSQSVAHIILDGFVNSGNTMFKVVRPAINKAAGKEVLAFNNKSFSPAEVEIINSLPAAKVFDEIKKARKTFYNNLVDSNPNKYGIYRKGWNNRIDAFSFTDAAIEAALAPATILLDIATNPKRKKIRKVLLYTGGALLITTAGILLARHHKKSAS